MVCRELLTKCKVFSHEGGPVADEQAGEMEDKRQGIKHQVHFTASGYNAEMPSSPC